MKQIEKIKKWIKIHKAMEPSNFATWLPVIAFFLGAILYDLNTLFDLNFLATKAIVSFVCIGSATYLLCWLVEGLVLAIYIRVCYHKTVKEFEDCLDFVDKVVKAHEDK